MTTTLLSLSGAGLPDYAARGLTQTLTPITAGRQIVRDINGGLHDWSNSSFFKYASVITGADIDPPALDGIWPGLLLNVCCICELAYLTSGGTAQRNVVSGSSRVSGPYTFYRPLLTMRILNFSTSTDEYGAAVSWSLELEEG